MYAARRGPQARVLEAEWGGSDPLDDRRSVSPQGLSFKPSQF
jgi:hypothetical protein